MPGVGANPSASLSRGLRPDPAANQFKVETLAMQVDFNNGWLGLVMPDDAKPISSSYKALGCEHLHKQRCTRKSFRGSLCTACDDEKTGV